MDEKDKNSRSGAGQGRGAVTINGQIPSPRQRRNQLAVLRRRIKKCKARMERKDGD